MGTISWGLERKVKEAIQGMDIPSGRPPNRVFVSKGLKDILID